MDDELKNIIEIMESSFEDMTDHGYQPDSEAFLGLTMKEFQRILHELHEISGMEYDDYRWIVKKWHYENGEYVDDE